ncbi:chromatin-remodeling complex subunit ies6 [Tulasnella sp. 427]|nr:chromatin-remodeling complex subunit ies6 [Tulasnella sp. 427]
MASKNATGPRKAKAVKIMLLAERDRELAEVKHLRKKREKALAEKRKGLAEAMDIDRQEENETKEGAEAPPKEDPLICYSTIEAPPSLIPATRYCDITGLEAPYTDPLTGLRYHDKDVFAHIRTLKPSAVQSYLSLRGGGQPVIV